MKERNPDWLAEWKERYPREMSSWDAYYPDIDREYVTFYPCDVRYLNGGEILSGQQDGRDIHVYVHVPFCRTLCPFCFFNKYPYDPDTVNIYLKTLEKEIYYYSNKPSLKNCRVVSIYFGGGTPTVLSATQVLEVIHWISKWFNIATSAEISIESSPLTIDKNLLRQLVEVAGVTRVSIGVQSFNDSLLRGLYLTHSGEHCIAIISAAKNLGIKVAIDLMYRLPNQRLSDWETELGTAVRQNVDTISCYSLELPPPAKEKEFANISLPTLEEDVRMYYLAIDYLKDCGYHQDTIADFNVPGRESSYVINCWRAPQHEYLGFGAGAHSFVGGYVFYNIASLESYFEWIHKGQLPILFGKKLTKEEAMSRYFVLGVKCLSVDLLKFEEIFGIRAFELYGEILKDLGRKELIEANEMEMRLTRKGLIYVDNISKNFYTANNQRNPQPVGIMLNNIKPTDFISKNDQISDKFN